MNVTLAENRTDATQAGRVAGLGAGAGVVAGLVMAMWAMGASVQKDHGFFTPLYHIASLFDSPASMMSSMKAAMTGGGQFHFEAGPALLGAMIHMMTGAMYGVMFFLLIARARLSAAATAAAGMAYGAVVFAVSSWIALPLAASVFSAGDPIRHMPKLAGWGTFFVEHLMYGVALGVLAAVLLTRRHSNAVVGRGR